MRKMLTATILLGTLLFMTNTALAGCPIDENASTQKCNCATNCDCGCQNDDKTCNCECCKKCNCGCGKKWFFIKKNKCNCGDKN